MKFPDKPHLSSLQEQVFHKVKTHLPFQTVYVREENNTLYYPSQYNLREKLLPDPNQVINLTLSM